MRRLDGRPHFAQHFDEAINGIRRLPRRRTQLANRIKRAIGISMAVNNQQPVHKVSPTLERILLLAKNFYSGLTGGADDARPGCTICPGTVGCARIAVCANGNSSSEFTQMPAGFTM